MTRSPWTPGAVRRIALSALFVAVIYWDVATILEQADLVALPVPETLGRYNRMFAVFKGWSPEAMQFVVHVRSRDRNDGGRTQWTEHSVHDLFPMPRGESFVRISTLSRRDPQDLARQLFTLYQRRHPEQTVLELRLYQARWPASSQGFLARYDERDLLLLGRY